ncbi:MAG: RQC domain-containing protein [Bacteroidia bacterium]|nr:RQC domain-containing protein [Bacteroidia bacterium]
METFSRAKSQLNIGRDAQIILQAIRSLNGNYGASFIVRMLRGQQSLNLRKDENADLPQFGVLAEYNAETVRGIINYLLKENYLQVVSAQFGSLGLTGKGEEFLNGPADIWVQKRIINLSILDRMLTNELRQIRRDLAQTENLPPFRIFTDYTLEKLVAVKPETMDELKLVPGFGDYKANRYGPAIFQSITRVSEKKNDEDRFQRMKQIHSPGYRQVKDLFQAGAGIEEIALKRAVRPDTIRQILQRLHQAGEINMKTWIEENISSEVLEKGVEYFRKSPDSRLKEAYENLGLDYGTLQMCKLYVADVSVHEDELPMAS